MRQAEPAAAARWLVRAVGGDAPRGGRLALACLAAAILVVLSTIVVVASVIAAFMLIAFFAGPIATSAPARGEPTVSWPLVAITTTAVVVMAAGVSWTSRSRALARDRGSTDERAPSVQAARPARDRPEHPPPGL